MTRPAISCALIVIGAQFLASCAFVTMIPALRTPRKVAFNEAEMAPYARAGSATVEGQIAITDGEGHSHIGIESDVGLFPVTAYTRETFERVLGNGEDLRPTESAFRKYRPVTTCDRDGNFRLAHVPAGDYYLIGLVLWSDPPEETSCQWAGERIKVSPHQTVRVALTHNPQRPGKPVLGVSARSL